MCLADLYDHAPVRRRELAVWDQLTHMHFDLCEILHGLESLSPAAATVLPPSSTPGHAAAGNSYTMEKVA